MSISMGEKEISFGREVIPFDAFPTLLKSHLRHCASTSTLEGDGRVLFHDLLNGGSSDSQVQDFVTDVCEWGGDDGEVLNQVIQGQDWDKVHEFFKRAAEWLGRIEPDNDRNQRELLLSQALTAMTKTVGLANSYGSKMLRMMCPNLCGVLDSKVRSRVGYENLPKGFAHYSEDLSQVANAVNGRGIEYPFPDQAQWLVANVDSVIFAHLKGWS